MDSVTPGSKFETVDDYIRAFPPRQQALLSEMRATIKAAAPEAVEVISYNMPAYKMNGILVYYAAYKNHIGFYPTASPISAFKEEIAQYKTSKGAIQFPIAQGIPKALVKAIVRFRVAEDIEKAKKTKTMHVKRH